MTSDRLPPEASFGRVGLGVNEPDRLARFYEDVVGLMTRTRDDRRIDLGTNDRSLLVMRDDPGAPPRPRSAAGLFHAAIRVPSRSALGEALARIRLVNALRGASDHGFSEALYFADPEDNGLEIYCDRPRHAWPVDARGDLELLSNPLELAGLPQAADGSTVPPGTDVGHVHLEVTDLDRSLEFYRDTIGFPIRMHPSPDVAFLAAGDYHHHVALNTWNDRTDPLSGRGLRWLELRLPTRAALDDLADRLTDAEQEISSHSDGLIVTDPDEIRIRCVLGP